MIAFADQESRTRNNSVPTFEELLPAIKKQAAISFSSLPPSEREDLVAETVANAFCAYQRLVERGKADLAYATPLARYAVKQVRSGRRVGSKLNVRDVTSAYCQRAKGFSVDRLDRYNEQQGAWQEVVVEDKTAGPADVAATRLDFSAWLRSLSPRMRRIANTLAGGETTSNAAARFKVSHGRISQLRRELRDAWLDFQGEPAAA